MASNTLVIAEQWDKVYKAFEVVNFVSYDYDSIKQSLLDYLKFYYPENFNDYIESSQLIAIIETFAFTAEQLAYRIDLAAHENFITTAQRKQSILKLAKLVSYKTTRNLPLRGLLKISSISCSENMTDGQGNPLTNKEIFWNDSNNALWKEQFSIVLQRLLTTELGSPTKSFQVDDSILQTYEVRNILEKESQFSAFKNGVLTQKIDTQGEALNYEICPIDVDDAGFFEREPNPTEHFSLAYSDDGYGDASDTTGYMLLLKQGILNKIQYVFDNVIPNRTIDINLAGINDTDVWVQETDLTGKATKTWVEIDTVSSANVHFNVLNDRKKYEISTLEDDKIRLVFGDGDFADIPTGAFTIWLRTSNSGSKTLSKSAATNLQVTFGYYSKTGQKESCSMKVSLVSALTNASTTEEIEHIREAAPAAYYSQNRMVNGQDYNTYMLRNPSILRLKAVNRTFAGQPKHITWNDASGKYQNVKVFGNDLRLYYDFKTNLVATTVSARSLIDEVLEPMLSAPGVQNLLTYINYNTPILQKAFYQPRRKFIERADQFISAVAIQEKTEIQGALDRHWYGEADSIVFLDSFYSQSGSGVKAPFALVSSDTDKKIHDSNLKLVERDSIGTFYPVNQTVNNVSGFQDYVARYKKFAIRYNPDRPFLSKLRINDFGTSTITATDVLSSSGISSTLAKVETLTIEIVDEVQGAFTVHGSVTGRQADGVVGIDYDSGIYKFVIDFPATETNHALAEGDTFIIDVTYAGGAFHAFTINKRNVEGRFEIIPESQITTTTINAEFDQSDQVNSWIIYIERVDDLSGNLLYWNVTHRDLKLIAHSEETRFFFDSSTKLIDQDTKKPVKDLLKILKSNLNVTRDLSIGTDQSYDVVDDVRYSDGEPNVHALSISPESTYTLNTDDIGVPENPYQFLSFIAPTDYVYFKEDSVTGRLLPVKATEFLKNLVYTANRSGSYVRKVGRDNLDFLWLHFAPNSRVIDPSPSNIIDVYVLTKGYYTEYLDYLRGIEALPPAVPTSLELKSTYRDLLTVKMISDSVVLHSGEIKPLFGSEAIPELRGVFRVIKNSSGKLTEDQIKIKIVDIINDYFKIENWDFAQTLHVTELISVIHRDLALEISSIVLVPKHATNYFGDLLVIQAGQNEILKSCAKISDVEIVSGYDRAILKQK